MSLFSIDDDVDVSKPGTERGLTERNQRGSFTESGLSSDTSFPTDVVQPARGELPLPPPPSEGLSGLPPAAAATAAHPSDSNAAAKDAIPLPVGALKPAMAAALRQERVALAAGRISATEESKPTTSARRESVAAEPAPPVLTPQAEYRFLADEPAHALPVYTDAKRGSMDFTDVRGGGAMQHRLSVNELSPQGTVPLTLTLFNHMSNAHEGLYELEQESCTSKSRSNVGVSMEEYASMKWSASFGFDELGAHGLRRTHALFTDAFAVIARDVNQEYELYAAELYPMGGSPAELDTSGPSMYDSASLMFSGAVGAEEAEGQSLSPTLLEADGARQERGAPEGRRGKRPCPSVVDGLRGEESLLRHFCSMPDSLAPHPPAARDTAGHQRRAGAKSGRDPLPPAVDAAEASTAPHAGPTSLRMRYRFPQPRIHGARLPELPKMDPRVLFGSDCIAAAPWVDSPRNVDSDDEDFVAKRRP
ncbi:hypothetical protein STCU_10008 [Strigomonas culicis]|uniref:Uncharacterized protein n=1 Tax=Strigomonas culicis TaxID=28005 RepID=S9UV14_9TRYP|nr:hypothetical protein STCU_10008 [Strigomonas culicis]|eukprot:EPY18371.1 hypothetical protein STCU_10008 [Strigomonas culicis]